MMSCENCQQTLPPYEDPTIARYILVKRFMGPGSVYISRERLRPLCEGCENYLPLLVPATEIQPVPLPRNAFEQVKAELTFLRNKVAELQEQSQPPLAEREVRDIAKSIGRYQPQKSDKKMGIQL